MKNVLKAPFITEVRNVTLEMYRHGWDERNGGNISYMLDEKEAEKYFKKSKTKRIIPLGFDAKELSGKYFVVTGKGTYFKNIYDNPERDLGVIRILEDGKNAALVWGYKDGGTFTSELPSHLISHIARLGVDGENRVVMHCHPTNLLAMNFILELSDKVFTHTLWEMCTECIAVFPEGIGVLPWMLCGTCEIGEKTAEKMKEFRTVVWGMHGVYAAGKTLDETFGLIETVEKAAEIYMLVKDSKRINTIKDEEMAKLADYFGIEYRKEFLNL